jgi:DNA polymerase III alpha subunit
MTTFNIELGAKSTDRDAVEVLNEIVRDGIATLQPDRQARWEQERRVFTQTKLTSSLVELQRLVEGLRDAGHRLQVVGSAASSMMLHAMGLSPLCPLEHGFHLERFIDPDEAAIQELQVTGLVSMTGLELLKFLWTQGYATRVIQHETKVNGELQKLEHIGANHEGEHRDGPKLILQLVTPSDLAIANLLSPEQIDNCLHDPATWELLGRGDTSGITNLEVESIQNMLRERKPRSLAELAVVMIGDGPGRAENAMLDYQEDLMSEVHREVGLPLREAYEFIRTAARNKPDQLEIFAENLMKRAQSNGIEEGVASRKLKSIQAKCRYALCKAHIFTTAHLALQTAYVKAHRPEEFQAVASVLRSETLH